MAKNPDIQVKKKIKQHSQRAKKSNNTEIQTPAWKEKHNYVSMNIHQFLIILFPH